MRSAWTCSTCTLPALASQHAILGTWHHMMQPALSGSQAALQPECSTALNACRSQVVPATLYQVSAHHDPNAAQATYQQGYGTVLDSGTTFTYLPQDAFREFQKQVVAAALVKGARQVAGPDPKVQPD